jgi:hypothetical protein
MTKTLILAILKVQTQGENTGKNVASEVKPRVEAETKELINVGDLESPPVSRVLSILSVTSVIIPAHHMSQPPAETRHSNVSQG